MPRVPRSRGGGEEKYSGAGVSTNPDINTTAVQTNGKIDFSHISNILEGAIDVLGNDNTKLATLENLLKTVLEKVAQKTRSRQSSKKRSSSTPPLAVPKTLIPPLTKKDLLSVGLTHAGFDHSRQNNVNDATNIERFKAFYGLEPTTLVPAFTDVKNKFPEATFHHLLITMNWLTLYDKYLVLSGRWGYHPDTIGPLVWRYARMIQSFLNDKVGLHHVDMDTAIPLSLDTATFTVNEIRTDPNSRWYDHKSYSSGFVSLSCSRLSIKVTSLTRHCLLTQLQKYEFSLSTKKPQIAWTNGPFPGSKHEREQNVSLQKELGKSLGSLQKMEESTELLRLEKDKAEMERSNAQRRIDQLEDQICGLLSSGKDFQYQLEWEREQNVSLQKELGDSRCEIERLREAGNELQHLLTSHLQQLESQIEWAHANTVTIEQEKEKMVDRCFGAEEQLAEATALQSEMQKQLLLGRQREDEMLVERTARELEIQQLQVQNTSLAEKQAELEKEVVYFKLQVERIMDEQFIDNMPPLVCDENVPCVEDELMEVERSEKNPKRKRKY